MDIKEFMSALQGNIAKSIADRGPTTLTDARLAQLLTDVLEPKPVARFETGFPCRMIRPDTKLAEIRERQRAGLLSIPYEPLSLEDADYLSRHNNDQPETRMANSSAELRSLLPEGWQPQ